MKPKACDVDHPDSLIERRVNRLFSEHAYQSKPVVTLDFEVVLDAIGDLPPNVNHGLTALGGGLEPLDQRRRFLGIIDVRWRRSQRPAAGCTRGAVQGERPARVGEEPIESKGDVLIFARWPVRSRFSDVRIALVCAPMEPVGTCNVVDQIVFGPIPRLKVLDQLIEFTLEFLPIFPGKYQGPRAKPIS